MDLVFSWDKLTGKPASSASAIDQAVSNSHTHDNKNYLDKIGQNGEGHLTYNGETVTGATQWITTNW